MPIEIYISVLVACSCIVVLTGLLITTMLYLRLKVDSMEKSIALIKSDLMELIKESRVVVEGTRQLMTRVNKPIEDIEYITGTARAWTDRTDRLVDAIETLAEPPLFFMSKKIKVFGGIANVVLQTLLNPKK